ncbi:SRPBCC family protein [Pseudooceanicola marinus]|uniref:SRPBCC family protein n=1 Tax=Pseudooceanicola marinus TaxID=396013 RepID=UPI001CD47DD3|nr:SRPBCC family protein [Pseudooceanicola marinus]MCA1334986.1 SRPBCC family protein [Pseudooceanicola marinus]
MDETRDLSLRRDIAAPPGAIWRCWTEPHLLCQWFAPAPVETVEAVIEARAGGRFFTRMRLPEGEEVASEGCVLAAASGQMLAFTDALGAGFRPTAEGFMTAIISLAQIDGGTRYSATVLHATPDARQRHLDMGFHEGWGAATDQLATLAAKIKT